LGLVSGQNFQVASLLPLNREKQINYLLDRISLDIISSIGHIWYEFSFLEGTKRTLLLFLLDEKKGQVPT
jgi:hypothetical protein